MGRWSSRTIALAIHLEESKLRQLTEENWGSHCCTIPKNTMNDRTEQKHPKRRKRDCKFKCSRVALGGSVSQQQGTFDRHPVTACNTRKKDGDMEPAYNESTRKASRLKLDVLGLSEVRWKNSVKCTTDEHVIDILRSQDITQAWSGSSP